MGDDQTVYVVVALLGAIAVGYLLYHGIRYARERDLRLVVTSGVSR